MFKLIILKVIFATNVLCLVVHANTGDFEIKQNDFASLFNSFRTAQPSVTPWPGNFWPYGKHGTAAKVEGDEFSESGKGVSPMDILDQLGGTTNSRRSVAKWERAHHTCDIITGKEEKEGCESWWGHCNGWAAAAIKEDEPRKSFKIGNFEMTPAITKGIFSEVWLTANSIEAGETDKNAKLEDGMRSGGWMFKPNHKTYKSFWDVTPRSLFLILTNYVGINKSGVAIDRDAGPEVWNHPIVGYRLLPIKKDAIKQEQRNGQTVSAVRIRMKLFWADDETPPGIVAEPFNLEKHSTDSDQIEVAMLPKGPKGERLFEGRMLEFTLFFQGEFKVDEAGTKVLQAGALVGDGIWKQQEDPSKYSIKELVESHPDFVWLPSNAIIDTSDGYGNPFLVQNVLSTVTNANVKANGLAPSGGADVSLPKPKVDTQSSYLINFGPAAFSNLRNVTEANIKRALKRVLYRIGLNGDVSSGEGAPVVITGNNVAVNITLAEPMAKEDLQNLLTESGLDVVSIQ